MRVRNGTRPLLRLRRDDEGATAVIVVLSLIALLGVIVLTVDVGQLLFNRRAMVNASDAAALAAAQACAGLDDSDSPQAMANAFAVDNVGVASGEITDIVGCDGPAFGHVSVAYEMEQDLFFAGVLGFSGPAAVSTEATAGWGPASGGSPLPIVIYTGNDQGSCEIEEHVPADISCYLWYDNNMFGGSAFGFLNLCTETDPCQHGWDVEADAGCQADRRDVDQWVDGTWTGGPNRVNYPAPTYVCRVSGLNENIWQNLLAPRIGEDLLFPVNRCEGQVDSDGTVVGCDETPHKYNIVGFIILRLDAVLADQSDWQGAGGSCQTNPVTMTSASLVDLDVEAAALGCTPYDAISDVEVTASGPGGPCCTENINYTYDADDHIIDWISGTRNNVRIAWEYSEDGPCGTPPDNSSAVCLQVTTVEAQFEGSFPCADCPDYGVRAVQLCDLAIGSCPENQ